MTFIRGWNKKRSVAKLVFSYDIYKYVSKNFILFRGVSEQPIIQGCLIRLQNFCYKNYDTLTSLTMRTSLWYDCFFFFYVILKCQPTYEFEHFFFLLPRKIPLHSYSSSIFYEFLKSKLFIGAFETYFLIAKKKIRLFVKTYVQTAFRNDSVNFVYEFFNRKRG